MSGWRRDINSPFAHTLRLSRHGQIRPMIYDILHHILGLSSSPADILETERLLQVVRELEAIDRMIPTEGGTYERKEVWVFHLWYEMALHYY
ncbi:hypothetical protein AJ80_04736 [Polytolypa hystricis UAMH7299]|uniref:Uncharacterized protein n=1 Tax=Polytolypa hystricis (strain UAMH7299) TaxID=1447883 RepID=A0A2B7Y9G3_POLH7|nr:hypothetical protein AJ80_04736 [Polytolypa hystricis UAMH7299]